ALGVEPHARCAPGLVRRALELCTELPYRKVAQALQREAGATLSERSLRRLVRSAASRVHLSWQRRDLGEIQALLVDGTRVRAGAKVRDPHDRGLELNIAVALRGRDHSGRRTTAQLELVGATLGRRWKALVPALREAAATPIAVSDGDLGIIAVLSRALPAVPQQICTFHLRDSIDHRLWGDRMPFRARRALARAVGNAVEFAVDAESADRAVAAFLAMAERHGWRNTLGHLRQLGPHLTTWLHVDPSGELEHTTSLLERLMREVNRRVDPVGVRWSRAGADAIVRLLLARRFGHPHWRRLCHDRGPATAWAELRLCQ
ncbi:MAG: transposase, partial [Candidatus Limnocylindria bacterium]